MGWNRKFFVRFMVFVLLTLVLLVQYPGGAIMSAGGIQPPAGSGGAPSPDGGGSPDNTTEAGLAPASPTIDVWYGEQQAFGNPGEAQTWANILGRVSPSDQITSLVYSLNGGPEVTLSMGKDERRLALAGDFNIDMAFTDLVSPTNQVVITATESPSSQTVVSVTVDYEEGNVWPNPTSIDWSSVTNIQDVAQIIDGRWAVQGDSLRTLEIGYDRLVGVGDMAWTDYEVTVPITVHSRNASAAPGIGIMLRWKGHTDDPVSGWQPKSGWWPLGAIGWYRWLPTGSQFQIYGNDGRIVDEDTSGRTLETGVHYIFKMRVVTNSGQGHLYSFKVWEDGQPEPSDWDLAGWEGLDDPQSGSPVLLAHYVDASFGDVVATPLVQGYTLTAKAAGGGSVSLDPDKTSYTQGEQVTLTAIADPHWTFDRWTGDASGTSESTAVTMTKHKFVTAIFASNDYYLTVDTVGSGAVSQSQGNPYNYGDQAVLEPVPQAGWSFSHWSGPNSAELVDEGDGTWTLLMDGDKAVTANFTEDYYDVTVTIGGGMGEVNHTPGNPYRYGEVAILEPLPAVGWSFGGWSGPDHADLVDQGNGTWRLVMDGDKQVTASFTEAQYILTVDTIGSGTVGHTPGNPYAYGQKATLDPSPDAGWTFVEWLGENAGELVYNAGDDTWSLTMDADKEVTARFRGAQYDVTVTVVGRGSVENRPGNPYDYFAVATLRPVASAGWGFAGWGGPDAASLYDNGDGTWSLRVDGDQELIATFGTHATFLPLVLR